ncbi:FRIGIDA-like protein 5 [Morus notabilis]|uniref:FRIGIDA-like protein 5 n=1 Tax=Morus notabilis TaxID=981085 RepID=UPI000CECFFB4|nr:FRIGIDA-like protein 5 [Morus notabilis]
MVDHLVSLQKFIGTRLNELEIKESYVKKLLKELESKEKEIDLVRNFDFGFGSMAGMDGKELLGFLSGYVGQQEKLHDGIFQALKSCEEPEKLVLDAVKEFYSENGEMDIGGGTVWKRSCVVLLEQLTRLRPKIVPPDGKAEAARLAREGRAKMKMEEGQKGVVEALGFFLLLGAYALVGEIDIGELLSVFESMGQQREQAEASELEIELGLAGTDPMSTTLDSQEKIDRSMKEELQLVNQIASSFASRLEGLKYFCVGTDGRHLNLFLYQQVEEYGSLYSEVYDALSHAPDPAKLVLDAIPDFLRSQPQFDKSLTMAKVRKSCILLLEQLMTISPQLSPLVRGEALKMADVWRANLGQIYQRPVTVYGFLLFLAAYGLKSNYEADELLRLLGISSQYKASPVLCQVLGLTDKVEVVIQTLIQKTLLLEAVDNIYAYELMDKFQPVRLLKGYLKFFKKIIYKKGNKTKLQQDGAIDREIAVTRTVIKYIAKYKLESEYPPDDLEKQIVDLENKKEPKIVFTQTEKLKSKGKTSSIPHSGVKAEPSASQKDYLGLDNQTFSFSTGPRLQLGSFCISVDGGRSSFLSHEHVEDHDSLVSSSASPWPELKSFCINMDGKSLRLFLYNHEAEHDFMCGEVCDALQFASDPAKLVLDAMWGILCVQPEFDKSLSLNTVRKSCVLLLEQLIIISPKINPHVKVEALKMANEWRANLGQQYQTGLNVYGFLHFIVAYGFTSYYGADELLGLLATANQHRASPGLCHILGLADKVEVLIENFIQRSLLLEAIEHIYAFELKDRFQPVHLLKDYLKQSKKKIYKKGTKSISKEAIDKEIEAVRNVIGYIAKFKLESEYRPQNLKNYIVELQKKKGTCK